MFRVMLAQACKAILYVSEVGAHQRIGMLHHKRPWQSQNLHINMCESQLISHRCTYGLVTQTNKEHDIAQIGCQAKQSTSEREQGGGSVICPLKCDKPPHHPTLL